MKTIQQIVNQFNNKIGQYEIYTKPTMVKNGWFGDRNNCIAYIEVLGLSGSSDDVVFELRQNGYEVDKIGLDLYIKQKLWNVSE